MTQPEMEGPRGYEGEGLTLPQLMRRLVSHWKMMTGVFVVVMVSVIAGTLLVAPRYRSTVVLRIMDLDSKSLSLGGQLSGIPGGDLLGLGRDDLETEVGVLRSWRVSQAVVDSLSLMVRLSKPAGVRADLFAVTAHGDADRHGRVTLRHEGQGTYSAVFKEKREDKAELGSVSPGGSLDFAGHQITLVEAPPSDQAEWPKTIRIDLLPRYEAIDRLRQDLEIREQEGGSRLVNIAYTIPDRYLAAAIVNRVADEYIAYKVTAERSDARYTVAELSEQVAEQATRLVAAEERLRTYQERTLIVAPEEEAIQQIKRIAQLQLRDDASRVEREALGELLALIDAGAPTPGDGQQVDSEAYRRLVTFPTLISNGAIQDLLTVLLELENQRAGLLGRRTPENSDVLQLTGRIQEIEHQLHTLGTDYLSSLDGQIAATGEGLARLNAELEALPEREMQYLRLFRDRTVLSEGYVLLQQQLRLAEVQDAVKTEGVRRVDEGLVAHEDNPEFPKPLVNLALGLILAGTLSVGSALARDLWEA